jgi:lipopolysaccharide transport system ATP-binding protein
MICGTLNPTSGAISTHGRIAALLELGSGFNPEFTGRENIYMNAAILGLSKEEIDMRFDDIIAFADIGDFIEQPAKSYSSGMVVRLAFSVAINVQPEILIVDEALSVGDELFQRKCFAKIEAVRESGCTILFVSHHGGQVIQLCDRALLIDKGQNILTDIPKAVVEKYQKLLYAPLNERDAVRAEIIKSDISQAKNIYKKIDPHSIKVFEEVPCTKSQHENFDPYLFPASTIEYKASGAIISGAKIETMDGHQINGLIRGRRYRYKYIVSFNKDAHSVRFGMSIKNTSGLLLGGAMSASSISGAVKKIKAGVEVSVEFIFDCNLNPGIYYFNTGAYCIENNIEMTLHRLTDILAFRVLSIKDNIETEILYFRVSPILKFSNNDI